MTVHEEAYLNELEEHVRRFLRRTPPSDPAELKAYENRLRSLTHAIPRLRILYQQREQGSDKYSETTRRINIIQAQCVSNIDHLQQLTTPRVTLTQIPDSLAQPAAPPIKNKVPLLALSTKPQPSASSNKGNILKAMYQLLRGKQEAVLPITEEKTEQHSTPRA